METYSDKLIRIKDSFDLLDPFNKDTAFEVVKHSLFTSEDKKPDRSNSLVDFIFGRLSDKLDITMDQLREQSREWEKAKARHIYVSMLYLFTELNHGEIAEMVGHTNHTTVNYSRQKVVTMIEGRWNPEMNLIVDLYMEIKHIAKDLGVFNRILPEWFIPKSYKDEVLALLLIGPVRKSKMRQLKWYKSYTKYGKLK